ncbi:hypothetical protein RI129_012935 [Pyrocoelia pectoralis]|uniref:CRAL-TRIO domain-containing protein n=1 Tax=Pyrocoelia pectoralis TaxID=417401 RepID=A0AAN7UUZ1_9COLE
MPLKYSSVDLEYQKRMELRREDVQMIKEWLGKQPHLPEMEEFEIITILLSCNYSVELTKVTIDNYYTLKSLTPEIFRKRDLKTWVNTLDAVICIPLSTLTPEGYQVVYARLQSLDPNKYVLVDTLKCGEIIIKMKIYEKGAVDGLVFVFDMTGFSLTHIAQLPVMTIRKLIVYMQEACPLKLISLHVINGGARVDKLMTIMRPFIKKELLEMIHIHSNYVETLFNYMPRECMPKDVGGLLGSVQEMQEKVKETVLNNMDFIEEDEKKLADESKRPQKNNKFDDVFGIEGTFRKMELD